MPLFADVPGHEGQLMKVPPQAGMKGHVRYGNSTGTRIPDEGAEVFVMGPGSGGGHLVRVRDVQAGTDHDLAHSDVDCGYVVFHRGRWHPKTDAIMAALKRETEERAAAAKNEASTQQAGTRFPFRSHSGDYRFNARRRGKAVVITGDVIGPPGSIPYLVQEFAYRRELRVFRLAFHNNSAAVPFVGLQFEHVEPDVPGSVELLKIQLPNEETVEIRSRRS